jgi:hypothetical protein
VAKFKNLNKKLKKKVNIDFDLVLNFKRYFILDTKWSENNRDHHFEYQNSQWVEKENGRLKFDYEVVDKNENQVILYATDRNFFVCLKEDRALWGMMNDECVGESDKIFNGKWMD